MLAVSSFHFYLKESVIRIVVTDQNHYVHICKGSYLL